jgi:hypothetical protein
MDEPLAVRGMGRLDDDYVVDALQEAYVVLRAVSTSETQIVQLLRGSTRSRAGLDSRHLAARLTSGTSPRPGSRGAVKR